MMQDCSLPQAATLHKIHEKADVKRPAKGRTGHGAQQGSYCPRGLSLCLWQVSRKEFSMRKPQQNTASSQGSGTKLGNLGIRRDWARANALKRESSCSIVSSSISEHKAISLWVTLWEYSQSTDSRAVRPEEAAGDHQVWGTLKVYLPSAAELLGIPEGPASERGLTAPQIKGCIRCQNLNKPQKL